MDGKSSTKSGSRRNVFPYFILQYGINVTDRDFVFFGKHLCCHGVGLIERANFNNLFFCKSCTRMFFSEIMSKFFNFIHNIVDIFSKPKMIWSYAQSVIAMMKNLHSFWNSFMSDDPRNTVSCTRITTTSKVSITMTKLNSFPNPAGVSFINIFPKSCFKFFYVPLQNIFITVLHSDSPLLMQVYKSTSCKAIEGLTYA